MKNRVITNKQREYNGEPDIFRNYWLCGVSDGSNTFTTSDARMVIDNLKSISPKQIYKNIELIEDIDILEIFNSYLAIKENDYYFILESRIPISFDMVDLFCKQFTFKLKTRQELADNLNKNGGYIPGVRPGDETVSYISTIIKRITFVGASALAVIAALPVLFGIFSNLPTSVRIGGTGLLIVVGVALETYKQIESQLISRNYTRGRRK